MHSFYKGVLLGAVVAVVVLMAGTALAGSGVGGVFNLGKVNKVNRTSFLSGKVSDKTLQVTNKGSGVALALKVKAGRPPLAVNSTAGVRRLNADLLDGLHARDLQTVLTARRDLAVTSAEETVLTVPKLMTVALWRTAADHFQFTLRRVDAGEDIFFTMPGESPSGPYVALLRGAAVTSGTTLDYRYLVWNSARAADIRVTVMWPSGSDRPTVFV